MSSNLLHLLFQPLDSSVESSATNGSSAAPISATSLWRGVCITMHNQDVLHRDTKLIRDKLGKGCLFALPMRRRAGVDHHVATGLDTYTSTLVESNRQRTFRTNPASLDVGRDTNAYELTFSAFLSLLSTQAFVVCYLQGFIQRTLIVTTIIYRSSSRLIWKLVWLDEIKPAYFCRVLAQFARHQVHGPLNDVGCLGTTSSTIGIRRCFIREDKISAEMYCRNVIGTAGDGES